MKTKFIDVTLPEQYSSPLPISNVEEIKIQNGREYKLWGQSQKSYQWNQRIWFLMRALAKTVLTLGRALYAEKTLSDIKCFFSGKKVVVIYKSALTQPSPLTTTSKNPSESNGNSLVREDKSISRLLPNPQEGLIKNGYGEYLIYRLTSDGKKEAITTEEYDKIFATIEECRALNGDKIPTDRHDYLKAKIREQLGSDVHIAFIPRTLYELLYLKQCVQEEIDKKRSRHARETGILEVLLEEEGDKKSILERTLKEGFWQQCQYKDEDYLSGFSPKSDFDYRPKHIRLIAARLNQIALSQFEKCVTDKEAFTFDNFKEVQSELISYFRKVHNPDSDVYKSVMRIRCQWYAGIAREMAEETTKVRGQEDQYPLGIANERHEQIVQKAIQLECSAEAINSLILYRGGVFSSDTLMRKNESNASEMPNSLSYGTSLYAGALYDGGATPFHYMRNRSEDAQAFVVPLKEQQSGKTPFHVYNVHPLIQVMSKGEIFHSRTKVWRLNNQDKVAGFLGYKVSYADIDDCCKTQDSQEQMEKKFQKYKDRAYLLASKETL